MDESTDKAAVREAQRLAVRDLGEAIQRQNQIEIYKTRLWMAGLAVLAAVGFVLLYVVWQVESQNMISQVIAALSG